ncbi:aspartyl-phosphate phosphatase Spo0E family protein [Paenibacillus beijingensis]|uniref:aspartyl-phosphate phosphatase Spo0E family protein n=1 Tax=Paenibacillus beijingensis TaxID=1126833 RepID=UPI000AE342A1|nr:aspartyl-phosphate phosphatase Spo0E family protein [Paenibacillus beijingensis]
MLEQLQMLRHKLHACAEARGSLTDPDVIAISEEADRLILKLQLMQRYELSAAEKPKRKDHSSGSPSGSNRLSPKLAKK